MEVNSEIHTVDIACLARTYAYAYMLYGVYFHSNVSNHPAKAKADMFGTDVGQNSRSALALIGREAHVLVSSTHAQGISPMEIPCSMFNGIPFTASRECFYACVR